MSSIASELNGPVTGVPSCHFSPSRRVNVYSMPSLLRVYLSTIWGLMLKFSSRPNSVS